MWLKNIILDNTSENPQMFLEVFRGGMSKGLRRASMVWSGVQLRKRVVN